LIRDVLAAIYGGAAARRRAWYRSHPEAVRRLSRPVVSVGNLSMGGSGKTPIVAAVARTLTARGERPAILSRGYARRRSQDGVTVVSDGRSILADVETAGDEPLMLARQLPGVAVLVGSDRYLSGRLAEHRLGATVHILDDGFQHLALARTADLLVVNEDDPGDRVMPAGRLREPLSAASAADAALVADLGHGTAARPLGIAESFGVARTLGAVPDVPVFAVAGIARPRRFFDDLAARGCRVTGTITYADHHRYSNADIARVAAAARRTGAQVVATTEKDRVRMPAVAGGLPIVAVPLVATIEPRFDDWLMARLA